MKRLVSTLLMALTMTTGFAQTVKTPARKPVSIFKWVSVDVPVKVKEVSPSNIETGEHVGKYKVELGVMKK